MKKPNVNRTKMLARIGGVLLACLLPIFAGAAQEIEQGRYQDRMAELAGHLGTLHHLRGSCFEAERQTWRDYMQEMVRLEDPSSDRKKDMVVEFNEGYESAKKSHPDCDRRTAREAESVAERAASLSDAIGATVRY